MVDTIQAKVSTDLSVLDGVESYPRGIPWIPSGANARKTVRTLFDTVLLARQLKYCACANKSLPDSSKTLYVPGFARL